jgi:outer membrane receptor protein involved in Fe transport
VKKIVLSVFVFCFSVAILSAQKVEVTVFIKDQENQKELSEVEVYLGDSLKGKTNVEGFFTLSNVEAGIKKLSFKKEGFQKTEVEQDIQNGGFYEFSLPIYVPQVAQNIVSDSIKTDSTALAITPKVVIPIEKPEENVSVFRAKAKTGSETAALSEQKKSSEIKEIKSGEELSRKGASNVAKGVEKAAGISNVQGRGFFVRGLEDRYNNLLINGLAVPSNNPFNKIIDLSLIPNDVVQNLEIFKTYNSNIYADFAGATINIETITPQKPVTRINYGVSYVTDNNFSKFLMNETQNSRNGFWGGKRKERDIPGVFGSKPNAISTTGQSAVDAFQSGFNANEFTSNNNINLGLFHAGKISRKLTYLTTVNFDNKYQIRKGVERLFNDGGGNYINSFQSEEYKYQTNLSALGALNYRSTRTNLGLNVLYLKSTEAMIKDQLGFFNSGSSGPNVLLRTNQYQESKFLNIQLTGDYFLTEDKKQNIKAGISYNTNSLEQPDRNFILGQKLSEDTVELQYSGNSNLLRQYFSVKGKYFASGMVEYNWNFGKRNDYDKISLGYNGYSSAYESSYRFVVAKLSNGFPVVPFVVDINNPDAQINQDLLNGILNFKEDSTNQYLSKLDDFVNAPYLNVFYEFSDKLQANLGVRAEMINRKIRYRNSNTRLSDPFEKLDVNKIDILPAFNLKYSIDRKSNVRFALSQTITRPTIMEVMPLVYNNPDNTSIIGNQNLKFSQNNQLEIKFETFPSGSELFATSIFGKQIDKPIEKGFLPSTSGQAVTYFNSKQATVLGTEIEFVFSLKRISPALKNFKVGANASYLYTNVKIDRGDANSKVNSQETFDERPLQGASNWITNADLRYDFKFNKEWQNTLSTVFNIYGKRIFAVGTAGFDHIYEKPMPTLDLVWTSTISDNWKLNFTASNILNPTYQLEHGNENKIKIDESSLVLKEYKKGVAFGLNATYTF